MTYMHHIPRKLSCVTVYRTMEDHDFTCGKKNGKLHRIQNDTGCLIQVEPVDGRWERRRGTRRLVGFKISGNKASEAAHALMGEFPAECTFHIPEEHHKRLIGYGGQTIQGVMKKYGVYVKFVSHSKGTSSGRGDEGRGPFGNTLTCNAINAASSTSMNTWIMWW